MSGKAQQYQGGASFTVFSAQGSNPLVNCKLCGKGIQKVYDKSLKGYIYACTGSHSSKLQLPKDDSKTELQLVHPFLVLQLFIPVGQHFTLELRLSDTTNTRRKMYFSTSFSELKITPLHCQIPISMAMRNTWLSLALHVANLFYNCFRVMSFRSVDVLVLGPVCKLRKIFTMRNRPAETDSGSAVLGIEEPLPQEHMFASGVESAVQVIDISKLQSSGIEVPNVEGCGGRAGPESVLSARKLTLNKMDKPVHVAFGSRMPLTSSSAQLNATPVCEGKPEKTSGKGRPPQEPTKPVSEKVQSKTGNARSSPENIGVVELDVKPEEKRLEDAPAIGNKVGTTAKQVKKRDEKRESQAMLNARHGRKEADLVKPKDFREQQARYEDFPPVTPCGWEREASARGSDDMNFKVHTLFEKLGSYAVGEDPEAFTSQSCEDGQPEVQTEGQSLSSPTDRSSLKEQNKEAGGLKFYQFELEKDFMLREENSASASEDDLSWCSGSSGRTSANAIKDLADFVKESHLASMQNVQRLSEGNEEEAESNVEKSFVVQDEQQGVESITGWVPEEEPRQFSTEANWKTNNRKDEEEMLAKPLRSVPSPNKSSRSGQSEKFFRTCFPAAEASEDESDLDLLYDPTLDCYYDPKTNKYYELMK